MPSRGHICASEKIMLHLLVLLLLASSRATLSSHFHREYFLINVTMGWDEAQSYCRANHTDLATIGSHDDMKRLMSLAEASGVTKEVWIGLTNTGMASWSQTSPGSAEYTNWASLPDASHHCGGMRGDGKWLSAPCDTTLPFVCQQGEGSDRVHVILHEKTWRKSQEYCRLNYTDLAAVRSLTENQALQEIIRKNSDVSLVWIGLFKDEWKWSDQSDSSFRYWEASQPNNDGNCTLYRPSAKKWFDRGCASSCPFYCYNAHLEKEPMLKKMMIRMEMRSSSFSAFRDSAVSKAILNQIRQLFEGFKVQWRVQPDGNIFHKKEKKKISKDC